MYLLVNLLKKHIGWPSCCFFFFNFNFFKISLEKFKDNRKFLNIILWFSIFGFFCPVQDPDLFSHITDMHPLINLRNMKKITWWTSSQFMSACFLSFFLFSLLEVLTFPISTFAPFLEISSIFNFCGFFSW